MAVFTHNYLQGWLQIMGRYDWAWDPLIQCARRYKFDWLSSSPPEKYRKPYIGLYNYYKSIGKNYVPQGGYQNPD